MPVHFPPTGADLAMFLVAFWPEFLATAVGVGLGIPAAQWFERWRRSSERKDAENAAAVRREDASVVLVGSILRNYKLIGDLALQMHDTAHVHIPLETSTWSVVQKDVVELFPDVLLRADIAMYYERVASFARLMGVHREYAVGLHASFTDTDGLMEHVALLAKSRAVEILLDVLPLLRSLLEVTGRTIEDLDDEDQAMLFAVLEAFGDHIQAHSD